MNGTGGSDTTYTYADKAGGTAGGSTDANGVYTYIYPGGLLDGDEFYDTIIITDDATGDTVEVSVTIKIQVP